MEKEDKKIILGVIFTIFDDDAGPISVISLLPKMDGVQSLGIENIISIKSITLLSGEERDIPKSLVIIPFPSQKMKGVMKYLEWKDETSRGGMGLGSIIMLIKEEADIIFYKYMEIFEEIFSKVAKEIINHKIAKASKEILTKELKALISKADVTIEELRDAESCRYEKQASTECFPDVEKKTEYVFKVLVMGDQEVGKTSTILRFTDKVFRRTYLSTIGVNISERTMQMGSNSIDFVLWDVAGQEKFKTTRKHYYKGVDGILLVYDCTRPETFDSIVGWYNDFKNIRDRDQQIIGYVLGNKCDLKEDIVITEEDGKILADKLSLKYIETSALTGKNVKEAFQELAQLLLK